MSCYDINVKPLALVDEKLTITVYRYGDGVLRMSDYKELYCRLAGKVAEVIEILIEAQRKGEKAAIEEEDSAYKENAQ